MTVALNGRSCKHAQRLWGNAFLYFATSFLAFYYSFRTNRAIRCYSFFLRLSFRGRNLIRLREIYSKIIWLYTRGDEAQIKIIDWLDTDHHQINHFITFFSSLMRAHGRWRRTANTHIQWRKKKKACADFFRLWSSLVLFHVVTCRIVDGLPAVFKQQQQQ